MQTSSWSPLDNRLLFTWCEHSYSFKVLHLWITHAMLTYDLMSVFDLTIFSINLHLSECSFLSNLYIQQMVVSIVKYEVTGHNQWYVICKRDLSDPLNFLSYLSSIVLRQTRSSHFYSLKGHSHKLKRNFFLLILPNHR